MIKDSIPKETSNDIFEGCAGQSIPEKLKQMSNEKLIKNLYFMKNNPECT